MTEKKEEFLKISQKLLKISFHSKIQIYNEYLKFCTKKNERKESVGPEFEILINKSKNQKDYDSENIEGFAKKSNIQQCLISLIPQLNSSQDNWKNNCK